MQLANKYDEEGDVSREFSIPSMLVLWAECSLVGSSLAMHFAFSRERGKQ